MDKHPLSLHLSIIHNLNPLQALVLRDQNLEVQGPSLELDLEDMSYLQALSMDKLQAETTLI